MTRRRFGFFFGGGGLAWVKGFGDNSHNFGFFVLAGADTPMIAEVLTKLRAIIWASLDPLSSILFPKS